MKKFLIVLMCLGMVGCAYTTMSKATAPNRKNLLKLSIGISKEEAINIMGIETFVTGRQGVIRGVDDLPPVTINNPYRSEILQGKSKTLEVVYYVTDVKKDDNAITDDELTPLVFDNGKLIGWGWAFLEENIKKYEIRVR